MIKLSNGMLSYSSTNNYSTPLLRVQLYFPEITLKLTEIAFVFKTILRIKYIPKKSYGIGFQILGFGVGLAWDK